MSTSTAPFACAARASAGEGRYGKSALASDSNSSTVFAMPPPPGNHVSCATDRLTSEKRLEHPSRPRLSPQTRTLQAESPGDALLGIGVTQIQADYPTQTGPPVTDPATMSALKEPRITRSIVVTSAKQFSHVL